MSGRFDPEAVEDITGQAGWVFSDMLVALMVVFLATITFIPQVASGNLFETDSGVTTTIKDGQSTYTYTEHFDKVFVKVYQIVDFDTMVEDIKMFLTQNDLPTSAILDSAQFVGGYDEKSETAAKAIDRASNFGMAVEDEFPGLLEHASTVLNSSPKIKGGYVVVRFTFSANITVER